MDSGTNITISQDSQNSTCPLQKVIYVVPRKQTVSHLKQSLKWIRCIGLKDQIEKLKPE